MAQNNFFQYFSIKYLFFKHLNRHISDEKEENVNLTDEPECSFQNVQNLSESQFENVLMSPKFEIQTSFLNYTKALMFLSNFYAKSNLSRKDTIEIQKKVTDLFEIVVTNIKDSIYILTFR